MQSTGECLCKTRSEFSTSVKNRHLSPPLYDYMFYRFTDHMHMHTHTNANGKCSLVWYMCPKRFLEDWLDLQWSSIEKSQTASRGFIFLQSTFLLPLFLLSSFLPLWKPAPVKPSTSYGYYSTLLPLFLSLSHPYFGLFHGLVLLDQPVSEKTGVE